jgi:2,4-dienoyl-CoA reductase-like NADH-dependent reductase (Old Yellow Enzyme family)
MSDSKYPLLFSPLDLGPVRVPNRICVTAMVTRLSGEDGQVNHAILERYRRFAEGGSGMIVVEASAIHGSRSGPLLRVSDDAFLPGLTRLAEIMHAAGPGKVYLQIIHFLKVARSGWRQKIDSLTTEEIEALPDLFAAAAQRAEQAGFDGVELHMAHAYTMSSLLSRRNKRGDTYGGTLENRMRLPGMVVDRVLRAVGKDFGVGMRFDAEECIKHGYTVQDSKEFAVRFAELGIHYISLSAGGKFEDAIHRLGHPLYPYTGYSGDRCMPGNQYPDLANMGMVEPIRRELRARGHDTPVLGAGKVPGPDLAEQVLQQERCDLVGCARSLLADPYWPAKTQQGHADTAIRCIYCNVCKSLDENFHEVRCYLWPHRSQQAPRPGEHEPAAITWPADSQLQALPHKGGLRLSWPAAEGPVLGYDLFRAEVGRDFQRLDSTQKLRRFDAEVIAGRSYYYYVQPYDDSGLRGPPTPPLEVALPAFTP